MRLPSSCINPVSRGGLPRPASALSARKKIESHGHHVERAVLLENRNNEEFYPREHTSVVLSTFRCVVRR
jgi:hypothetical protein